jgi:hypothetical protein
MMTKRTKTMGTTRKTNSDEFTEHWARITGREIGSVDAVANIRKVIKDDEETLRRALETDSWGADALVKLKKRIASNVALLDQFIQKAQLEKGLVDEEDT